MAERTARLGVISTADRPGPNYELFHHVVSFPSPPAPRLYLARAIPLAPVAAADPCVTRFDIERAVPVRCDRASDAGHPSTST